MKPKTEREIFLAVATPEDWDCWLSFMADWVAGDFPLFYELPACCSHRELWWRSPDCLFCKAFGWDGHSTTRPCEKCMGDKYACERNHHWDERVDAAIVRLEKAGIWDEVEDDRT